MAAPTLQAESADAAATTGTPGPTMPAHLVDDIIIAQLFFWGPTPGTVPNDIPTPSSGTWNLLGTQVGITDGTNVRGKGACFWKRATTTTEGTGFARGANWDTGADTCYYARLFVVRGCETSGNPFDEAESAGPFRTANQSFATLTVSGSERTAIQFGARTEVTAFGNAPASWTAGTSETNTGGTDGASHSYRLENISTDATGAAPTVSAVTTGGYFYVGASFKPPAAAITEQLAAVVSGVASITAALTERLPLATAINGAAAVTLALTEYVALAATPNGAATVSGNISGTEPIEQLATVVSGVGSVVGSLTAGVALSSTIQGVATVYGDLSGTEPPAPPGTDTQSTYATGRRNRIRGTRMVVLRTPWD